MIVKRHPRKSPGDEKGMVLVVGLLLISVLSLVGTTAVMTSTTDMKISSNYRSGAQAFYIAEAGIEQARAQLLTLTLGGTTLSQALAARVGANNQLSDSTNMANFFANGAFVTDDVPIAQTPFGGGTYRVYLTNDSTEPGGVTYITDTNLQVTLTSFGQGPNNALAVVQAVVKQLLPPIPGMLTIPGPGISFETMTAMASTVNGGTASAVALTSDASRNAVIAELTAKSRLNDYTCNTAPGSGANCVKNEAPTIDPAWNSVSGIEKLYRELTLIADTETGSLATPTDLRFVPLGNTSERKVVVVKGDAFLTADASGAGVLIVTGQLSLQFNFSYSGIILCIGQGKLLRIGGNTIINGAVVVARTRDASNNLLTTLGDSTFNGSGGGNTTFTYQPSGAVLPATAQKFITKSWKQFL